MMPARDETRVAQEQRLTGEQVRSLSGYGRERRLAEGEYLFNEKGVVDSFFIVIEGEVGISRLDGAEETRLLAHGPGEFTGGLAVLTGKRSIHRARADAPTRVLEIDSKAFRRVAVERPEEADALISGLARRMRFTQRAFRQHEKLAALGKLSAGLAHELNNPASAAIRASRELGSGILIAQLAALEHDARFSPAGRHGLADDSQPDSRHRLPRKRPALRFTGGGSARHRHRRSFQSSGSAHAGRGRPLRESRD